MRRVLYLSGPHINVEKGYWLYDQIANDGYNIVPFYLYKYGHSRDFSTKIRRYIIPLKLLIKSRKDDVVLLYDVTTIFIIVGLLTNMFRLKRNIVAVNFMGNGRNKGYERWKQPIIRVALRNMKIGVNSVALRDIYSKQLCLPQDTFFLVKDCICNVSIDECDCEPDKDNYIFMGGNTRRDWSLFKKIVTDMPQYNFVASLSGNDLDDIQDAPNLKIYKCISLDGFNQLEAKCKIVILPLTTNTQGGLLVAFQGNVYRKPIIISDTISTNTYYEDNDVLKVPLGDADAWKKAIIKVMRNDDYCKMLSKNGYEKIKELSPEKIYGVIKKQFA